MVINLRSLVTIVICFTSNQVRTRESFDVALQELDYDMAYIPGSQNVVADAMSRLCENHMHDDPNELDLRSMDISASVIEKFEIPQEQ